MVKTIKKIKVQTSKDDELVEECKKATERGECQPIAWTTPPKGNRIDPPSNTVAIVVDIVDNRGAIRIFEKEGDEYVNGMGTEEAGSLVIVPWDSKWWFRVSGYLRVGHVAAKDAK